MIRELQAAIDNLHRDVADCLYAGARSMQGNEVFARHIARLEYLTGIVAEKNKNVAEVLTVICDNARKLYETGTDHYGVFLLLCRSVRYALADSGDICGELEELESVST